MALDTLLERKTGPLRALLARLEPQRELLRWLLFGATAVLISVLMPRQGLPTLNAEVGRRWQQEAVVAPFDFALVKEAAQLARERRQAVEPLPDVYAPAPEAEPAARLAVADYFDHLEQIAVDWQRALRVGGADSARRSLEAALATLSPRPDLAAAPALLTDADRRRALRGRAFALVDAAYAVGYVDHDLSLSRQPYAALRLSASNERIADVERLFDSPRLSALIARRCEDLPPLEARLITQLLAAQLKPNYRLSTELYEQDRRAAEASVAPSYGLIRQGQVIVAAGQRITPEIQATLRSLTLERQRREGSESLWLTWLGQLALVSLLLMLTAIFLRTNRRDIWERNRKVALLLFTFVLMTLLNAIVIWIGPIGGFSISPTYLVPMSMAPIMLTVFFDDRVGFFANIIIALLAGLILYNSFEYFFIQVVAGSVAVSGLTILRRRSQIFTTAGALLLAYWGAFIAYNLALRGSVFDLSYGNLVLFVLNVLITLGTYPLIYFFERLFGITSDLTYLELLDTDHPLLKELSLKAPGTYQHSLQVANIAEHVATQIGANALQVRVGALFHDIGKVYQPDFFVENQKAGYNPHERIDAHLSAEIIINHVDYGIELGRKHNLPPEIIDFIRSHHGTSRVEHFYRSYVRAHPGELTEESDFRYKGPRPRTKEQAILMLSDAAEAASRSLTVPTHEALHGLTQAVITSKITDGQLDEARISFREVATIRHEIDAILRTIYHARIAYAEALPTGPSPTPRVAVESAATVHAEET